MDRRSDADIEVLAQLRVDFPGYRIWRARRPDCRPGDWVASLHDSAAGVDPTVIARTPEELRTELERERERARDRREFR
jgi:hypothetical protein